MNPSSGKCCIKACPLAVKRSVLHGTSCVGRSSRVTSKAGAAPGTNGFVAHNKKDGSLLGAVWLRRPIDKTHAPPELAFAVKPEHRRHGIGTALLTQLVRANPEQSTICLSFVKGKPVFRLYERFGFKVVEEQPHGIVMNREV